MSDEVFRDPALCTVGCRKPRTEGRPYCGFHWNVWMDSNERSAISHIPKLGQSPQQREAIREAMTTFQLRLAGKRYQREMNRAGKLDRKQMVLRAARYHTALKKLVHRIKETPEAWVWTYEARPVLLKTITSCPGSRLSDLLPVYAQARKVLKSLARSGVEPTPAALQVWEQCEQLVKKALEIAGPFFDKTPDWRPGELIPEDYYAYGGNE